jgi:hypothetical protein
VCVTKEYALDVLPEMRNTSILFHERAFPGSQVSGGVLGDRMYAEPLLLQEVQEADPSLP